MVRHSGRRKESVRSIHRASETGNQHWCVGRRDASLTLHMTRGYSVEYGDRSGNWYDFGFLLGAGSPILGVLGRSQTQPGRR
jgi:hypothetical protein